MAGAGCAIAERKSSNETASFHRSRVHILLAEKDSQSREEVLELLLRCSYQVTAVDNTAKAMEVLKSGRLTIDLVLAEVELPNGKGFRMLKHIMRDDALKRIPVIMMSLRDEMAIVVKCLRLGAADFLVKPLRMNELLNLWTHMWRRRRSMGPDRIRVGHLNMNDPPQDLLFDVSESNTGTGSTDLFSDDTDERKRSGNVAEEASYAKHKELVPQTSPRLELSLKPLAADLFPSHGAAMASTENGGSEESLRAKELQTSKASAFFNYPGDSSERQGSRKLGLSAERERVQAAALPAAEDSSLQLAISSRLPFAGWKRSADRASLDSEQREKRPRFEEAFVGRQSVDVQSTGSREAVKASAGEKPRESPAVSPEEECGKKDGAGAKVGALDGYANGWAAGFQNPLQMDPRSALLTQAQQYAALMKYRALHELSASEIAASTALNPHVRAVALQTQVSPALAPLSPLAPMLHSRAGILPPLYHTLPPDPAILGIASGVSVPNPLAAHPLSGSSAFPFYSHPAMPLLAQMPSAQLMGPSGAQWPLMHSAVNDRKMETSGRREAALNKFRQKRKDRCFEKKIRYVSRKRLAEQRPRNRGQFVRQSATSNGKNDDSEEDEDDVEEEEDDVQEASSSGEE